MSNGGLKRWTALPGSFPRNVGIEDRTDVPPRVEKALLERTLRERNRKPPEVVPVEAEDLDHFLNEGRRRLAEQYLDTQLVAFRFEGEIDPDPSQAPLASYHPMREVVRALEEETYLFRPELVFGFFRECLARFPARLPQEDAYQGPLNDDEYDERVQSCLAALVSAVALERPSEPFEWIDAWLDRKAAEEYAEATRPRASLEERAEVMDVRGMSPEEFARFALDVFTEFDKDKNGALDVWEFKDVLRSTALDLSKKEIREIISEADVDGDGKVDYHEFVPIFHELVGAIKSKMEARELHDAAAKVRREEMEMMFVKGMTREELDATLRAAFDSADADGNGVLDPSEFLAALQNADLGLSKKEMNLLLAESDLNGDGVVEYEEFVPMCFEVLVERAKNKRMESEALKSEDGVTRLLLEVFSAADEKGTGKLRVREIKACLKYLVEEEELSLSPAQIVSVVAECDANPDNGLVQYARFTPKAADVIYGMLDLNLQRRRVEAINDLAREKSALTVLRGMSPARVEAFLREKFAEADVDGSGGLDDDEILSVLRDAAGELRLTPKQISGIIAAADDDGDGVVDYNELAGLVYQTVKHMAREDWIRNRAFRNRRAAVKSRSEILATRDDTLEANIASMSTDDTTHLRDFDTGGRQAKLTNQRSVRIRLGGNFADFV